MTTLTPAKALCCWSDSYLPSCVCISAVLPHTSRGQCCLHRLHYKTVINIRLTKPTRKLLYTLTSIRAPYFMHHFILGIEIGIIDRRLLQQQCPITTCCFTQHNVFHHLIRLFKRLVISWWAESDTFAWLWKIWNCKTQILWISQQRSLLNVYFLFFFPLSALASPPPRPCRLIVITGLWLAYHIILLHSLLCTELGSFSSISTFCFSVAVRFAYEKSNLWTLSLRKWHL